MSLLPRLRRRRARGRARDRRRVEQRRGRDPDASGEREVCPGARPLQGLHRGRGPHALGGGLQRLPEDARGAARPRGVRPRHHRPEEDPAHRALALPALRLPAHPRRARSRAGSPRSSPRRRWSSTRRPCRCWCARRRGASATPSRCSTRPSPTARGGSRKRSVARLLGASSPVQVRALAGALLARDGAAALEAIDRAARQGEDLAGYCRDVVEMLRRLLVVKVAPASSARRAHARGGAGADGRRRAGHGGRPGLSPPRAAREPGRDAALALSACRARDRRGARHAPPPGPGHRDVDQQSGGSRAADARRRGRRGRPRGRSRRRGLCSARIARRPGGTPCRAPASGSAARDRARPLAGESDEPPPRELAAERGRATLSASASGQPQRRSGRGVAARGRAACSPQGAAGLGAPARHARRRARRRAGGEHGGQRLSQGDARRPRQS